MIFLNGVQDSLERMMDSLLDFCFLKIIKLFIILSMLSLFLLYRSCLYKLKELEENWG